MADLILAGGRVIDPVSGRDEMADVAFGDGTVTGVGRDLAGDSAETIDARGLLVVPGLIDLHAHVYWAGPRSASTPPKSRGEAERQPSSRAGRDEGMPKVMADPRCQAGAHPMPFFE